MIDNILDDLVRKYNALSPQQVQSFFHSTSYFGRAFVINMKDRTERMEEANQTLTKMNIPFSRFVALNGKEITKDFPELAKRFDVLRPGELGCLLSHLTIIHLASKHPNPDAYTLIFEDDIVTSSGESAWKNTLNLLHKITSSENDGLIYLGKCFELCSKMVRVEDNVFRAVAPSCCHAYMIRHSFAKRVIKDSDDPSMKDYFNKGIDSILGDYIIYGKTLALVLHPALFYQDVLTGGSDLRSEYLKNYQECRDTCGETVLQSVQHATESGWWRKVVGFAVVVAFGWIVYKNYPKAIIPLFFASVVIWFVIMMNRTNEFYTASTLTTTSTPANHFSFQESDLLNKTYNAFNPNGILIGNRILLAVRVNNIKHSYTVLHELDPKTLQSISSKILLIDDDKKTYPAINTGYEDMRIFSHGGNLYLIGVNIDRNPLDLPAMVLVDLSGKKHPIYLKYKPLQTKPNKNWAPITLPGGDLGFVVDVDPLLIVKMVDDEGNCMAIMKGTDEKLSEQPLRNSTITYRVSALPNIWKNVFQGEYLLFVHIKHVTPSKVIYQHYILTFDLTKNTPKKLSKPFHVETELNPHIEYISGVFFLNDDMIITYGLHDTKSKYIRLKPTDVKKFL